MAETPSTIFHVMPEAQWTAVRGAGELRTSTRGRSLDDEGFIHCSGASQVLGTANSIFGDLDDPLVVLGIAVDRLTAPVRYENVDGGAETFPHVYGPVPVGAVVSVAPLLRDGSGRFTLGDEVAP